MEEQTYEEKPEVVAIAVLDDRYRETHGFPYGLSPYPEGYVADMTEGDPNAHCFFVTIGTDVPLDGWMTPEEYAVLAAEKRRIQEEQDQAERAAALEATLAEQARRDEEAARVIAQVEAAEAEDEENEVDAPA